MHTFPEYLCAFDTVNLIVEHVALCMSLRRTVLKDYTVGRWKNNIVTLVINK